MFNMINKTKEPRIITVNRFNEQEALQFRNTFKKIVDSGQSIVPIIIDSYGGECYSLMSMAETITESRVPVATIATGKAMSSGSLLLSFGTEGMRYIGPLSTVLIHDVSAGSMGKVHELRSAVDEAERINKLAYETMAKNIGKPKNYFLNMMKDNKHHADWFLTAKEAKDINLANHIKIPNIKIDVMNKITLE